MPTDLRLLSQPSLNYPLPLHILACGRFSTYRDMIGFTGDSQFAAGSWPTANLAIYYPISIPNTFTVARFMTANPNSTGNEDVGLYNAAGTRLLSTGSTARTGAGAVQYISVTAQSFPAGHYYLGLVLSSTGGQIYGSVLSDIRQAQACGILQEALGATTLPATMTPARVTNASGTVGWNFGFTQSATL